MSKALMTALSVSGVVVGCLILAGVWPGNYSRFGGVVVGLVPALTQFGLWIGRRTDRRVTRRRWVREYGKNPPAALERTADVSLRMMALGMIPMLALLLLIEMPRDLRPALWKLPWTAMFWFPGLMIVSGLLTRADRVLSKSIEESLRAGRNPCLHCGYDLTMVNSPRCSECGVELDARQTISGPGKTS